MPVGVQRSTFNRGSISSHSKHFQAHDLLVAQSCHSTISYSMMEARWWFIINRSSLEYLNLSQIPSIAYGTGSVNHGIEIHEYIKLALDTGFIHIDTAQGNLQFPDQELDLFLSFALKRTRMRKASLLPSGRVG